MAQFGSSDSGASLGDILGAALKKGSGLSDLTGAAPRGRASSTYRKGPPLNRAGGPFPLRPRGVRSPA